MTDDLATLRGQMERAALALDFEEAGRLRDLINLRQGQAAPEGLAEGGRPGFQRQVPGKMGLGTSEQAVVPPPGWRPPPKPDLMTHRRSSKRSR